MALLSDIIKHTIFFLISVSLINAVTIEKTSVHHLVNIGDHVWANCSYTLDKNETFVKLHWLKDGHLLYSFVSAESDLKYNQYDPFIIDMLKYNIEFNVSTQLLIFLLISFNLHLIVHFIC